MIKKLLLARANLRQKQADLAALQAQKDRMTIRAPIDGLVVNQAIRLGEMATAGGTLLTLANLDEVRLTVYVPESEIGRVTVGQRALVTVDSFPGRAFEGCVTHVSSQAEFTPKSVQRWTAFRIARSRAASPMSHPRPSSRPRACRRQRAGSIPSLRCASPRPTRTTRSSRACRPTRKLS